MAYKFVCSTSISIMLFPNVRLKTSNAVDVLGISIAGPTGLSNVTGSVLELVEEVDGEVTVVPRATFVSSAE
jgi:hypothetical protein